MSLDMNMNIASAKPIVREAQNMQNDGGGGNLGYMSQGNRDEKKKKSYLDESIFGKKQEDDVFVFSNKPAKEDTDNDSSVTSMVGNIIGKALKIFKN